MLPAYVVLLTPDHHVPFANRFFRERFGESCGRRCFEYLFGRTEPCEPCDTYKVLQTNSPHQWQWTGPDSRNYDVHDFPFTDTDGSTLILEMGIDVTERKRAEEELRRYQEHLEELVKARTLEVQAANAQLQSQAENLAAQTEELRAANEELRSREQALLQAKERWERTFNSVPDLIAILDDQHRVVQANRAMAERLGATPEQCVGLPCYKVVHGTDGPPAFCPHTQTLRDGCEHMVEVHEDRLGGDFLVSTTPLHDEHGRRIGSAHVARDITQRKRREARITRLTSLYAVLSRVNEAIVRTRDEQSLFSEVCRIVAEEGGFPLVWIGRVNDRRVGPVASSGPAQEYLEQIEVRTDGKLGRGPTGTCIRENRVVVNDDFATNRNMSPWRQAALKYGLRASAAFPLRRGGDVVAALTLYAPQPGVFDAEQVALLESLVADVSYALDALDQEQLRIHAERSLRETRDYLDNLFNYANAPIIVWDPQLRITRFNHAFEHLTGRKAEDVLGCDIGILFPPDERAESLKHIQYTTSGRERWETIEIAILHVDGSVRTALWNSANVLASDGKTVVATIAQGAGHHDTKAG